MATTSTALPTIPISAESLAFRRAEAELIDRFRVLPVANIGDAMDRLGIVDPAIHPVWAGARTAGSAFTVWTRSGDNVVIHQALDIASPGDILAINGGGDVTRALFGELMGLRAKVRGLGGIVIDGAVRDAADLGALGLPVFARGTSPAGPYKNGPGRLLVPIALGGVAVRPGDVIVGDGDGLVVVPLEETKTVLEKAEEIHRTEATKRASYLKPPAR